MIQKKQKLVENVFDKDNIEKEPTRNGYGRGVVDAGEKDEIGRASCRERV